MPKPAVSIASRTTPEARAERLATQVKDLNRQIAALEAEKTIKNDKLLELLADIGERDDDDKLRAETESWKLVRVDAQAADKIEKRLLLKYGVSIKIINKCTIEGKKYSYPGIYPKTAATVD